MAATKPAAITLLHLSDLQFGKNHLFGRTDLPAPDGWYDSLFVRLKDDLESLKQKPHELNPICGPLG